MKKSTQLRNMIQSDQLEFIMEAHNGLSAKIVEETGFKGIWASGLSISASLGVRDNNEASWTQIVDVLEYMSDATTIPILMDGDTGFGNFNNARRLVKKLEQVDVAGVCIEDKQFPKTNSFLKNSADALADMAEFCGKIKAMKDAQTDPDFVVVARLESFIAGVGLEDAICRAEAYANAGADALLVHSKRADAKEIDLFMKNLPVKIPVIIVPTKYYTVPTDHFRDIGISLVIWANHNCRACITAMKETSKKIFEDQNLMGVEDQIATVSEVFRIQGNDELERAEKMYLPKVASTKSVILAASRGNCFNDLTENKPKTMIKINGKSILEKQAKTLKDYGITDITVVRGYKKEAVKLKNEEGIHFVDNDEYETSSEVYSLALAKENFGQQLLVTYGDLIFKKHLIFDVLECEQDVAVVVNKNDRFDMYHNFIFSAEPVDKLAYDQKLKVADVSNSPQEGPGKYLCGNSIGILAVKENAMRTVKNLLQDIIDKGEKQVPLHEFLKRIMEQGIEIGIVSAADTDWVDVNTLPDLERAIELM